MRVQTPQVSDTVDSRVEVSARVTWSGGEGRIAFTAAPELLGSDPAADATPFATACLLPAAVAGEDLLVEGPVSARLSRRLPMLWALLGTWDPSLRPPGLRAASPHRPSPPGHRVAAFFSRGVDSMFTAALERTEPAPLDALVRCQGFDPRMGPAAAALDRRMARTAAGRLGLPLTEVEVDVQGFTNRFLPWPDAHGAVLGAVAQFLAATVAVAVIPGTDSWDSLVPFGSHPLLDRCWSTERVEVLHDEALLARVDKVRLLATQRPDLLPHLKVCFAEDRPDNCGRCGKCLLTMSCLVAADALPLATSFPDRIDLGLLSSLGMSPLQSRFHWAAVSEALATAKPGHPVGRAIDRALLRSAQPTATARARQLLDWARGRQGHRHPSWRDRMGFDWAHQARVIRILEDGRPAPDPVRRAGPPPMALRCAGDQPDP